MGRKRVDLTEGPILPQLLRFAFPILMGTIVSQLYNVADSVIVGDSSVVTRWPQSLPVLQL